MKPLLTLTIAFLILLAPAPAFAQNNVNSDGIYTGGGLIPCGQNMDNKCNSCHVVVLANTVIKWLIGITFMIFAGMAVYAGVKMVISGGNSHAKQDAKEMFTNAFIGLLIILGAWLMIDTLLRYVLKNGETGNIEGYGPWSQVKCVSETEAGITQMEIDEDEFVPVGADAVVAGGGTGSNCPAAPASGMVAIPAEMTSGGPEMIRADILEKFKAMRAAALKEGITLKVTDGWRPEKEQVDLFNKYCPTGTCGDKKAARPCTMKGHGSNHNSGTALDIAVGCGNPSSGCNTKTYQWLKKNGGTYGFLNNLPTDPPHWSPSGK